jgi:hypothetical protein
MLALYRSGRQADALESYQTAARVLADGHGLDPGPGLHQLQAAILAHDPSLAAGYGRTVMATLAAAPSRPTGNVPAPLTSFIGRQDQLIEVGRAVRECRQSIVARSVCWRAGAVRLRDTSNRNRSSRAAAM